MRNLRHCRTARAVPLLHDKDCQTLYEELHARHFITHCITGNIQIAIPTALVFANEKYEPAKYAG